MATTIKIGEEVTVGTTATEYLIDESTATLTKPFQEFPVSTNSANSGTIKFSVGVTPPVAQEAVAADKKRLIVGVQNGVYNIWAVGSASGQKFTVGL
jgi:hypothetical protein